MRRETASPVHGIKIRRIANICIVLCLAFMAIIYTEIGKVDESYRRLISTTQDCFEGQKCAISLERSSDYLTRQVRLFVVERKLEDMYLYFDEVEGQNREKMVADLEALYGDIDPETVAKLDSALQESKALEQLEVHAMCLMSYALGTKKEDVPEAVAQWEMTEEEKKMSEEELIDKAYDLVYGKEYLVEKQLIKSNIQGTLDLLAENMGRRQARSREALEKAFQDQRFFIFLILAMVCIVFWLTGSLIIYPVGEHVRSIQADRKWKILGAYEMRYLAFIYNRLYDKNEAYKKELEYRADHDGMTGIYNRAAFEKKGDD